MRRSTPFVVAALTVALAGCGTHDVTPTAPAGTTATPLPAPTSVEPSHPWVGPHNRADLTYAQMITAHRQVDLAMADLAVTRATDPAVEQFAARTVRTREADIERIGTWQTAWGAPTRSPDKAHAHDESLLIGGRTPDAVLADLRATGDADFDKAFLDAMIAHRDGAVMMSTDLLATGVNPGTKAYAQKVVDDHRREVDEMKALRGAL